MSLWSFWRSGRRSLLAWEEALIRHHEAEELLKKLTLAEKVREKRTPITGRVKLGEKTMQTEDLQYVFDINIIWWKQG